jgi:hypothetical protein
MSQHEYIKYTCNWEKTEPLDESQLIELNKWRNKLYGLNLIGAYDTGVGFGNISVKRDNSSSFLTTGTATGSFAKLDGAHYAEVTDFDISSNILTCRGPIKASSESMTHGAVYLSDPEIKAVIHVHSKDLWDQLIGKVPTTSKDAKYGTPEIADEVMRLFRETDVKDKKIIVLGGHQDGILAFGSSLEEAGSVIIKHYQNFFGRNGRSISNPRASSVESTSRVAGIPEVGKLLALKDQDR